MAFNNIKMDWGPTATHYNLCEAVARTLNPQDNKNFVNPIPHAERIAMIEEIMNALINGGTSKYVTKWYKKGNTYHADVPVALLDVVAKCQRIKSTDLFSLYDEYNPDLAMPIRVSYRDGHWYIWDGMHTGDGAICNGYEYVAVIIFTGLTEADEARMFVQQDDNKSNIPAVERYEKGLTYHDPRSDAIQSLSSRYGFTVMASQDVTIPRPMTAIKTLWGQFGKACNKNKKTNEIVVKDSKLYQHSMNMYYWVFNIFETSSWMDIMDQKEGNGREKTCSCLRDLPINAFAYVYNTVLTKSDLNLDNAEERLLRVTTHVTLAQLKAHITRRRPDEDIRSSFKSYLMSIVNGTIDPDDVITAIANTGHNSSTEA